MADSTENEEIPLEEILRQEIENQKEEMQRLKKQNDYLCLRLSLARKKLKKLKYDIQKKEKQFQSTIRKGFFLQKRVQSLKKRV